MPGLAFILVQQRVLRVNISDSHLIMDSFLRKTLNLFLTQKSLKYECFSQKVNQI